jgi:hypothetical protein
MCVKCQFHKQDFHMNIHLHFTRNRDGINLSQHKLKFFTKKTSHMGSNFFNNLAPNIKTNVKKTCFQDSLKGIYRQ